MGLSASQARLLSITARLTQNETRSQLITNAKLRLADKSGEASREYMDSLNATKFIYTNYDSTGTRRTQDFTFGAVTQFSEIKNQYGFIDSVGRILVSAEDAKNYENSGALADFLACYDIGDTNNPQRDIELDKIYGEEFGQWYDDGNPHNWLDQVTGATSGIIDDVVTNSTSVNPTFNQNIIEDEAAYEQWKENLVNAVDSIKNEDNKSDGLYNTWLDEIKDVPDYIEKPIAPNATPPTPPTPPDPDDFQVLDDFVQYVVDGQCYRLAEGGANCYMHVLSDLLGPGEHITSSGQRFTVIQSSDWDWNTCHVGASGHTYGGQIDAVRDIINKTSCQDDPNKTIYQKIVDFLWDTHGDYDGSSTGGQASQANLDKFFEIIHVDLAAAKDSTAWDDAVDDYNKKYQEYEYNKSIKMTKQEIKDEWKNMEGDPVIKSKIKSAQMQFMRQKMMNAVPTADVVVANPTHFSVALKYDKDIAPAPVVVAKGVDYMAFKIREIAKANGVPIVENKPLARSLYKLVKVDQVIPAELYVAVAEILAFVYGKNGPPKMRINNPNLNPNVRR